MSYCTDIMYGKQQPTTTETQEIQGHVWGINIFDSLIVVKCCCHSLVCVFLCNIIKLNFYLIYNNYKTSYKLNKALSLTPLFKFWWPLCWRTLLSNLVTISHADVPYLGCSVGESKCSFTIVFICNVKYLFENVRLMWKSIIMLAMI